MTYALHKLLLLQLLTCLGLNALGSEIINGKNVPENLMLYMASVQNDTGHHVCGGFLISEDFVLTAAHCESSNPTNVVLGIHNLKNVDKTMRYTVKTCKHPCFHHARDGDDIMLLKLSKKAQLNNRVQPIQLPKSEIKIKNKAKCRVAGWGCTKTGGEVVDALQVVEVPFVSLDICKRQWKRIPFDLPDNVICAGGYKTDNGFCKGDSGGPLVCGGTAVGVVSFNKRKHFKIQDVPNVYTNISKYLRWLKQILKQNNC
ncbi:granzyme B(G,H)-like [Symphorus nematophorus]